MEMDVYINKSDRRVVNKQLELIEKNVQFWLKTDATDVMNPSFYVTYKNSTFDGVNYVVTHSGFGSRRYFVNNIEFTSENTAILHCHVDVLSTYWDEIKNRVELVARQEFVYSNDIIDTLLTTKNSKTIEIVKFNEKIGGDYNYYITVTGGIK